MKKKNLLILLIAILTVFGLISCDGLELGSVAESEVVQAASAGNLTDFIGTSLAGESVTIPNYVTTLTYTYSTKDGTKSEATLSGGATLTLAEGVYSFTYGDSTFSAYVYSESDTTSAKFDGGFGTSAWPYLISDSESFLAINEVGVSAISGLSSATEYYFTLESDISIVANSWFSKALYMNLDGNGYSLTIEDPAMDIEYTSASEFALFRAVKGSISNLDFHTNGMKGLVYYACGSLTIENVDAYGEVDGLDSNIGVYVIYSNSVDLKFKDCTNYANIIDSVGGNYYGAVFLAYPLSSSSLTFENCVNYGEIIFGQWAAMFIGNGSRISANITSITITDCYNYAPITGGTNSSIIAAYSDLSGITTSITFTDTASSTSSVSTTVAAFDSAYASYVNKGDGSIGKLSETISSLSVSDGVLSFSSSADYDTVAARVQYSVSYYNSSSTSLGTRTMTFDAAELSATNASEIDTGIKEVHLIDTVTGADQTHFNLELSNSVLYVDPWAYLTSSSYSSGYTVKAGSTINYYLILRKDGKLVGLKYKTGASGTLSADSTLTSNT